MIYGSFVPRPVLSSCRAICWLFLLDIPSTPQRIDSSRKLEALFNTFSGDSPVAIGPSAHAS